MARGFKHKPFKKAPRKPSAPRPVLGPARAGFTYGYQWSAVQPPDDLRFPMDFGLVKLYPVQRKELHPVFNPTGIQFIAEWPETGQGPVAPPATLVRLHAGYKEAPWKHVIDDTRVAVALDWHQENGFDLQPFHLSGKSWGAYKAIRDATLYTSWRDNDTRRHFPVEWMNELVDYWRLLIYDGTQAQWSKAPGSLWWLDTELHNPDAWYDLREDLWPGNKCAVCRDPEHAQCPLTDPNCSCCIETQQRLDEEDAVAHDAGGEPDEPDIDGGDITTEDDEHWFQYGRLYVTGDRAALQAAMERDHYYPNIWRISDHGNAERID